MHKALKGKGSSGRQFLVSMTLPLEHSAYCVHVNTCGTQIHYDPCTLILFFPLYNTTWIHSIFNPTQCSCLSKQWRQTWFECKEDGGQCRFIFTVASHHVATQVPHVTPCRGREAATTLFYSLAVRTGSSHDTHSNVDGLYILCSRFLSVTHTEWEQMQCSPGHWEKTADLKKWIHADFAIM